MFWTHAYTLFMIRNLLVQDTNMFVQGTDILVLDTEILVQDTLFRACIHNVVQSM